MGKFTSIGERMKDYENISRIYLTKRSPVIIRIDGKAFHTFTKGFKRPFDPILMEAMKATAKFLCENITGCKLAYTQSDEISLLLTDYDTLGTQPWFENNLQKLVSISASMATLCFNKVFNNIFDEYRESYTEAWNHPGDEEKIYKSYLVATNKGAIFDARAFIIPKEEVCNYFIWRQQDATRNSILMVAQSKFSHNEMQGKTCDVLQDMLFKKYGINWNDYPSDKKRGTCIIRTAIEVKGVTRHKWEPDKNTPIFTQDREYIDRFVFGDRNTTAKADLI